MKISIKQVGSSNFRYMLSSKKCQFLEHSLPNHISIAKNKIGRHTFQMNVFHPQNELQECLWSMKLTSFLQDSQWSAPQNYCCWNLSCTCGAKISTYDCMSVLYHSNVHHSDKSMSAWWLIFRHLWCDSHYYKWSSPHFGKWLKIQRLHHWVKWQASLCTGQLWSK